MTDDALGDPRLEGFEPTALERLTRVPDGIAPALAVTALVLAVAVFSGFGLLSGTPYVPGSINNGGEVKDQQLLAGGIGVLLCGLPLALGLAAARRARPTDPSWTAALGRGAALAATIAAVLKVVATVVQQSSDSPGITFL